MNDREFSGLVVLESSGLNETLVALNCSLYKRVLDYDQSVKSCIWPEINDKYPTMMESLAALQVEAKKLPKVKQAEFFE